MEEVNKLEDPIDSDDDSLDGRARADHENLRCGLEQLPHRNLLSRISSEGDLPNDDYDIKTDPYSSSPIGRDRPPFNNASIEETEVANFGSTARKGSWT